MSPRRLKSRKSKRSSSKIKQDKRSIDKTKSTSITLGRSSDKANVSVDSSCRAARSPPRKSPSGSSQKKLMTKNATASKLADGSQKNVEYPTMKVVKVAPKAEFYRSSALLSLNWLSALKDRTLSQTHSDSNKSVDPSKKGSPEDAENSRTEPSNKKISVKSIIVLTLIGAFLCVVFIVFIMLTTFPAYYNRKSSSLNDSEAVTSYVFGDGQQNLEQFSNVTADTWNLDDNFLALYKAEMSKTAAKANLSSINFINDGLSDETPLPNHKNMTYEYNTTTVKA